MSRTLSWQTHSCTQPSKDDFSVSLGLSEHLLAPQMYHVSIFANSKRVSAMLALEDSIAARGKLHAFCSRVGKKLWNPAHYETSSSSGGSLRFCMYVVQWAVGLVYIVSIGRTDCQTLF